MNGFAEHHSHFIAAQFFGCNFCKPWIFFYVKWMFFQKRWLIIWCPGVDPAYESIDLCLGYGTALRHGSGKNGCPYICFFCRHFWVCGKRPSRIGAAAGMATTVNGAHRIKYGLYIGCKPGADTGTRESYAIAAARSSACSIAFTTGGKYETCWKNSKKDHKYFSHHWNLRVFCYH